jgi:hypothetical protein
MRDTRYATPKIADNVIPARESSHEYRKVDGESSLSAQAAGHPGWRDRREVDRGNGRAASRFDFEIPNARSRTNAANFVVDVESLIDLETI